MPDATKRILTDETGQDIVSALETLCTLVDPNGTAVAAAEKINNMTISVSGIAAGSSPTASVSEVDGHKHIALGIPVELPVVSSQDNGKVMMVKNGAWDSDIMDNATSETAGLMSAEDKQKLDGIEEIEIYQEIESNSNSVSFSDGAEAPLKELVIDIEPKQDLHGYSKPWVGGAGKNLLNCHIDAIKQINTQGTWSGNKYTNAGVTYTINVNQDGYITSVTTSGTASNSKGMIVGSVSTKADVSYAITGCPSGGSAEKYEIMLMVTYALGSGAKSHDYGSGNTYLETGDATRGVQIVIRSGQNSDGLEFFPMLRLASNTDSTFEPYSNLCPISGYDTVDVTDHGENLVDISTAVLGKYIGSDGVINTSASGLCYTKLIPVAPGEDYIFYIRKPFVYSSGVSRAVSGYNSSGTFVSRLSTLEVFANSSADVSAVITIPSNVAFVRINGHPDDEVDYFAKAGTFATYPIAVSLATNGNQTAGTVYSGTVTLLADGSGQLVVDHRRNTYDGSLSWNDGGNAFSLYNVLYKAFNFYPTISNEFKVAEGSGFSGVAIVMGINNKTMYVYNAKTDIPGVTDLETWKTFLNEHPLEVIVPIEPVTYTLTANQVQTLLGYNYIYTDGAEISLTYVKDTSGLMTTADKIKLNSYPTKLSQLTNDAGYLTSHQSLDSVAPKADPVFTGSISLGRKANTTTGTNSFAVGNTVEASGANSHAEGNETRASYQDAHAEGWGSEASSQAAHAEGRQGRATAYATHAEGVQTTASGYAAHAQGLGTQATNKSQHTAGEYNVLDPSTNGAGARGTYAEIIGNGADANNRSNARALDWSGNERLMGDVYVGCNADSTGGTKLIKATDTMTGATSSAAGAAGLVPAPATTDVDKFLSGDGTYKSGGLPMVILSYGNSTWSDFINAYHNNVIVYCRASSNANPASGKQTRMAFMAYVNDADAPTQVEFQYYRSMNPTNKSISQMSDQVFVYTLSSNGTWSVISREASIKSIVFDASSGLTGTYDKNTGTLTISAAT